MTPIYVNPNIVPRTVQISNKVVELEGNRSAVELEGKIARLRDGSLILRTDNFENYTVKDTILTLDGRMACVVDRNSRSLGPAIRIQEVFEKNAFIGITTPVHNPPIQRGTVILANPRNQGRVPSLHRLPPVVREEVIFQNPRFRPVQMQAPAVVSTDRNGRTLVFQPRGAGAPQTPVHHVGHAPVGRH